MKIHNVVDFTFLYYKYKCLKEIGKIKSLTCSVECQGVKQEKDVTVIYYAISEIEKFRKDIEERGNSVITSVCFDMPSFRKKELGGEDYKADRKIKLNEDEFLDIQLIEKILKESGVNTYRYDGYEADDLVRYIVNTYKDSFDYSVIYTPDKDLLANLDTNVGVRRYKTGKGYTNVTLNNYAEYTSKEFKCDMELNTTWLYLSTVGDVPDHIKGVKGFGVAAYNKLMNKLRTENSIDFKKCNDVEYFTNKVFNVMKNELSEEQFNDFVNSWNLVKPIELNIIPSKPEMVTTYELRKKAFEPYGFVSLFA